MSGSLEGASGSQTTLVNPVAYGKPQALLYFLRDNMLDTKIATSDGRVLYTVETDKLSGSQTTMFCGSTKEIMADINRRSLLSDTIKFGQEKSVKIDRWMRGVNGKYTDYPVTFEYQGAKYTWKTNKDLQIALYDGEQMIAWFQHAQVAAVDDKRTRFYSFLALLGEFTPEFVDRLVVSFILVKQSLRSRETRAEVGSGMGQLESRFFYVGEGFMVQGFPAVGETQFKTGGASPHN